MDPLAIGIFTVAAESPLQSILFTMGGLLHVIGIGYGVIIGMTGEKHKHIGFALMMLGAGIAAYPTLSMAGMVLAGDSKAFSFGWFDMRLVGSIMLIGSSVIALRSALKENESEPEDGAHAPT